MNDKNRHQSGITGQRYVRVTRILQDKYVEFEFAIGDPTISVELVLPFEHFKIFCRNNNAKHMTPQQEALVNYDKLKWRFGVPGFCEDENNEQHDIK